MINRAFIIHGWEGDPLEGWFPWLKKELEKKNWDAYVPAMPNTSHPTIDAWVAFLSEVVDAVGASTFFVGHSIGCQAILRFLETLPDDAHVGGAVFVAPWMTLTGLETKEEEAIAKPWILTPINFEKVRTVCPRITAIFSDNDPFVPLTNQQLFKEKLGAKILTEHAKGHFSGSDQITELPSALEFILSYI